MHLYQNPQLKCACTRYLNLLYKCTSTEQFYVVQWYLNIPFKCTSTGIYNLNIVVPELKVQLHFATGICCTNVGTSEYRAVQVHLYQNLPLKCTSTRIHSPNALKYTDTRILSSIGLVGTGIYSPNALVAAFTVQMH